MSNGTDHAQPPSEKLSLPMESRPKKRASPGDNWAPPPGWTTEEKVRTSGTKAGLVDKVSNWFINARVRVWKPMVEEIHMLETRQSQKSSSSWRDTTTVFPDNNNNPSSSTAQQRANNNSSPARRVRNDDVHANTNNNNNHFMNAGNGGNIGGGGGVSFSYGIASSNVPGMNTSTNGGVSLTLGLHHQIGLPEPFPMTTAQSFGLDGGSSGGGAGGESYGGGGGGYEGQDRPFGRDFIGGSNHQFLHDFVG